MFKRYWKKWGAILSRGWQTFAQRGEQMVTTSMESRYEFRVLKNSRSMSLPNSDLWSIVWEKMGLR